MTRQAEPTAPVTNALPLERLPAGLALELRRALRDERVALPDEAAASHPSRDDHLAPVAERVGHHARVDDRHRDAPTAVADAAAEQAAAPADRAGHDLAGDLVRPAGRPPQHLRGALRLGGLAKARPDERASQQHGSRQRHHEADLPLAGRIHGPTDYGNRRS